MKFIYVPYHSGLGNQLFQYAAARGLMSRNDHLLYDIDLMKTDYLSRKFGLSNFQIGGSLVHNKYVKKLFTPKTKLNVGASELGLFSLLDEKGFYFHKELINRTKFLTKMQGFWQSEDYFKHKRSELLSELIPINLPVLPVFLAYPKTVAIHVRRKDYLEDSRYGFLGITYYDEAIAFLREKVQLPKFIVFSDDMDWCKENFVGDEFLFVTEVDWQSDYLQLYLISLCKHQIIANSSFSWWAAWLNKNENKMVLRPQRPFRDKTLLYENYYPKEWLAI